MGGAWSAMNNSESDDDLVDQVLGSQLNGSASNRSSTPSTARARRAIRTPVGARAASATATASSSSSAAPAQTQSSSIGIDSLLSEFGGNSPRGIRRRRSPSADPNADDGDASQGSRPPSARRRRINAEGRFVTDNDNDNDSDSDINNLTSLLDDESAHSSGSDQENMMSAGGIIALDLEMASAQSNNDDGNVQHAASNEGVATSTSSATSSTLAPIEDNDSAHLPATNPFINSSSDSDAEDDESIPYADDGDTALGARPTLFTRRRRHRHPTAATTTNSSSVPSTQTARGPNQGGAAGNGNGNGSEASSLFSSDSAVADLRPFTDSLSQVIGAAYRVAMQTARLNGNRTRPVPSQVTNNNTNTDNSADGANPRQPAPGQYVPQEDLELEISHFILRTIESHFNSTMRARAQQSSSQNPGVTTTATSGGNSATTATATATATATPATTSTTPATLTSAEAAVPEAANSSPASANESEESNRTEGQGGGDSSGRQNILRFFRAGESFTVTVNNEGPDADERPQRERRLVPALILGMYSTPVRTEQASDRADSSPSTHPLLDTSATSPATSPATSTQPRPPTTSATQSDRSHAPQTTTAADSESTSPRQTNRAAWIIYLTGTVLPMDSPLVVNSLFESHSYEELLQLVEQFGSGPPPNNQERIDGYLPVYFFKDDGKLELHTAPLHRKWPPEAVDSLETILHDQLYSIEQGCCICKVEYIEGDLLRGLPCRHGYHKDCIDRWLKSKNLCPLCRHDVVPTGWKVPEEASETAVTDSANTSPSS